MAVAYLHVHVGYGLGGGGGGVLALSGVSIMYLVRVMTFFLGGGGDTVKGEGSSLIPLYIH